MYIQVLGSAAGGGFPQWNCSCPNCAGIRKNPENYRARSQSSIAVSSDQKNWVVINTSPDVRQQIAAFPPLQPQSVRGSEARGTGIRGVILVDSQIDHTTGLLILREGEPLNVHTTRAVHDDLTTGYPIFNLLDSYCGVNWNEIPLADSTGERCFQVDGVEDIEFKAMSLISNAPPYSPHRDQPIAGNNIALMIYDRKRGKSLFYAPGLAEIGADARAAMSEADVLLVDGTCWTDDELKIVGKSRTARAMGHLPMTGAAGMAELLEGYPKARKVLIHINNTNPILRENSDERAELARRNIEVSFDGMSIEV